MYGIERVKVSEASLHTYNLSSTMRPNISLTTDDEEHFCKVILYKEIKDSRVRIWDVAILVPNLLFLLFIAVRFNRARLKLRATSSPIFLAFYGLVICNVVISVIRCVVSMTVNAAATVGGKADKVLWVTVRFFLLSTEMSVVIFGLAFGHLDSRSSIRRVLLATSFIALAFTITQGTLELVLPDDTFHIPSRDFYVFGHGGMMFWFCSSLVFTMIYLFILILPWTRLRDRLTLPTRKSFYIYAATLAMLDLIQSIGAGFLNYTRNPVGLCIVDFTAAVYLTLFTPLVYHTFLSEFFGVSQPSIMFSYKAQVDDAMDEDTVSLPHQQSFSSLKTDSDYIYQVHTPSMHTPLYDSHASKSSTSRQRTPVYSLAPKKDSKSSSKNSMHAYNPQLSLYRSTSSIKSFARRFNVEKSTFDLGNYPLTRSDNFVNSRENVASLRHSHFKYGGPSSVSNLLLTSNSAASIFRRSKQNVSSSSLFSQQRESDFESTVDASMSSTPGGSKSMPGETVTTQSSEVPPLEDALHSILSVEAHSFTVDGIDSTFLKDDTSSQDSRSDKDKKVLNYFVEDTKGAGSEIDAENSVLDAIDISSDTHALLPKSILFTSEDAVREWREDRDKGESGGLSAYLLSLAASSAQKSNTDSEATSDPTSSHDTSSHTKTESL